MTMMGHRLISLLLCVLAVHCHPAKKTLRKRLPSDLTPARPQPPASHELPTSPTPDAEPLFTWTGFTALLSHGRQDQEIWQALRIGDSGPFSWSRSLSSRQSEEASGSGSHASNTLDVGDLAGPITSTWDEKANATTSFVNIIKKDLQPERIIAQQMTAKTMISPRGEDFNLSPPEKMLDILSLAQGDVANIAIVHAQHPDHPDEMVSLIGLHQKNGLSMLLSIQTIADETFPPLILEQAATNVTYDSLHLTYDAEGALHASYVRSGKLLSRSFRNTQTPGLLEGWSYPTELATTCQKVSLVTGTMGTRQTPWALAYACETELGCGVGVTVWQKSDQSGVAKVMEQFLGLTQPRATCLPFRGQTPGIAISGPSDHQAPDHDSIYVTFAKKVGSTPSSRWDLGIMEADTASLQFSSWLPIGDPAPHVAWPLLQSSYSSSGAPTLSLLFLKGEELRLASHKPAEPWAIETLWPDPSSTERGNDTEPASDSLSLQGRIIELSGFHVH